MSIPKIIPFDAAELLDGEESIEFFLADALASGDAGVFQDALATAARARGMASVAKDAGLGRESLYKALRADASPRFDTVQRVIGAFGLELAVIRVPAKAAATAVSASALTSPRSPAAGQFVATGRNSQEATRTMAGSKKGKLSTSSHSKSARGAIRGKGETTKGGTKKK